MKPLHALRSIGIVSFICVTICKTRQLKTRHYSRVYEMDKKVFTGGYLEEVQVKDMLICVSHCNTMEGCNLALFHLDTNQCRLYDHAQNTNNPETSPGWKCWKLDLRFGDPCLESQQCNYRYGKCLRGKCSCVIGFSYDFHKHECVTDCSEYGAAFSMYHDSGVNYCNVHSFRTPTGEDCVKRCRNVTKFVCINCEFDVSNSLCNLCNMPWTNLSEDSKVVGTSYGWLFYYRHCQ